MRQKVTPQKLETMRRLYANGKGLSFRLIAHEVGVSPETVMYHLSPKVREWRKNYEARPERVERYTRCLSRLNDVTERDATLLNTPSGIVIVNTGRR